MKTTSVQDKPNPPPREMTEDEVRQEFLTHVRETVKYWADLPKYSDFDKCEGVAFSILTAIDGCSMALPGFMLIPAPHPDDKAYHEQQGKNWYPDPPKVKLCDIAGGLCEEWEQLYAKKGLP